MRFVFENLKKITEETTAIETAINKIEVDVIEIRSQLSRVEKDLAMAMQHTEEQLKREER